MDARNDITDFSDTFDEYNEMNFSFQGKQISLTDVKTKLSRFKNKFVLYQRNFAKREFFQVASLQKLVTSRKGTSKG